MDMHRAFHMAENLYSDESLAGIEYVAIGFKNDPETKETHYEVHLFNDVNDDRNTPDYVIASEKDYENFYATVAMDDGTE